MWRWGGNWCLREEPSRQREQLVQRPWGMSFPGLLKVQWEGASVAGVERERERGWCRGGGSCHRAWWALLKTVPSGDGKPLEGIESRSEICSSILRASLCLLGGEQAVENQEQKQEGQGQNDSVTSHFTPRSILRADIQTSYWWRTNIQHRNRVCKSSFLLQSL